MTLRTIALWAPLSMGILQARTLECVAMPSSRGSSGSRHQTLVSCLLRWRVDSLPLAHLGCLAGTLPRRKQNISLLQLLIKCLLCPRQCAIHTYIHTYIYILFFNSHNLLSQLSLRELDSEETDASVQFSLSVVSDSLRPHKSQHAGPPCPSQTPGVYSNSCPSSR